MGAGPLSDDKAVKAAEKLVAVYVDCTNDGQNQEVQEKYKIEGYPTLLFVSTEEKILEDVYPESGEELAKKIGEIVEKHAKRPWITPWAGALEAGAKEKKPVAIVFAGKKDFSEWEDVEKWLKKELKEDFDKFVFGYSLPESDDRKELEKKLAKKDRKDSVVVVDPRAEKPFEKPLADPGKTSEKSVIEALKKALKAWKE
jgi:hypothetical protein